MSLVFRNDEDGNPCLKLGRFSLEAGTQLEVRLAERKWIPVWFVEWTGNQNEPPVFEIRLPVSEHPIRLGIPTFCCFRFPGDST